MAAAVLALALVLLSGFADAQTDANVAVFEGACSLACGAFETCVVFDGAEHCTPFCALGRCNDATETCIVVGRACDRAPCLPVVVCEPIEAQPPPQQASAEDNDGAAGGECARQCAMENAPVCGSNGVSYANKCFLDQAQCVHSSVSFAYYGLCEADAILNAQYNSAPATGTTTPTAPPECDAIVCSPVLDPVCTTNGTMTNLCLFKKAQCADTRVELLRRTACEDASGLVAVCPAACTQEYVPVCASNGIVYGNDCLFRQAKCERRAYGELRARDLSYCELQVGVSQGAAIDIATWLASTP